MPKNKSLNAFLNANKNDIFVTLGKAGENEWNIATEREKKLFGLWLLMENTYALRKILQTKKWSNISNKYLLEIFEAFESKDTLLYKKVMLFANTKTDESPSKIIRSVIPLFEEYWEQTHYPSATLLDAIAGISELKD